MGCVCVCVCVLWCRRFFFVVVSEKVVRCVLGDYGALVKDPDDNCKKKGCRLRCPLRSPITHHPSLSLSLLFFWSGVMRVPLICVTYSRMLREGRDGYCSN